MSENSDLVIETRVPVIGPEDKQKYPLTEIDRQWRLVTEAIRQDLVAKPETRRAIMDLCNVPVSEVLPRQFLQAASATDPRIAKLAERYATGIKPILNCR
jgi:hypothetical protein